MLKTTAIACASAIFVGTIAGAAVAKADTLEVFSFWTSGSENAALHSLYDAYEAKFPNVKIESSAISGGGGANAQQVLQTRIAGGNPPEVWQTHPGDILETFTSAGLVHDISSIAQTDGWAKVIPPSVYASMSVNGKVYTAITGVHRQNVLWYNKAVIKKLGITITPSFSFADFVKALGTAKAAGVTPLCNGDQLIFTSADLAEDVLLAFVGPDGMEQLYKGTGWESPKVADALKAYGALIQDENSDHSALTWDEGVKQFGSGRCAFNAMADSAYGELRHSGLKDGVDFGYVAFPGTQGSFLGVGDSFVVNAKAKNMTDADRWMETIESPSVQLAFSKLKGSIPVRTDVNVASLGQYQQMSASDYRTGTILNTMTYGQSVTPAQQQAYYDAITIFDQSQSVPAFVQSMKAAFDE